MSEKRKVLAIDINDVIRDYSEKFISLYKKNNNPLFNDKNLKYENNDLYSIFKMSKMERDEFMYVDYPLELFGFAKEVNSTVAGLFNIWVANLSDYDEYPEVVLMSCEEHEKSIPATYFFLSRSGVITRKMFFPETSNEAWELADIIITANPKLIQTKPEDKTVIKIETKYNKEIEADYSYETLNQLIDLRENNEEKENFKKIIGVC